VRLVPWMVGLLAVAGPPTVVGVADGEIDWP
jgi:hypothetical protein